MLHRIASRTVPRATRSIAIRSIVMKNTSTSTIRPAVSMIQNRSSSSATKKEIKNPGMMCRQCEQTQDHFACTNVGVCGKSPETSVSLCIPRWLLDALCIYNFVHDACIIPLLCRREYWNIANEEFHLFIIIYKFSFCLQLYIRTHMHLFHSWYTYTGHARSTNTRCKEC